MKKLLVLTGGFSLFILFVIFTADLGVLPQLLKELYDFPGGDKVGHFFLYGILSFLLNVCALILLPDRYSLRLVSTVSLLLSILVGLEEWSQVLFSTRSFSVLDFLASFAGVVCFAWLAVLWKRISSSKI